METPPERPQAQPFSATAAAVHLGTLTSFAVAAPLFDLLSRQAEFFVAHDTQPVDLVLITLALSLGLPGGLALLAGVAARFNRSIGWWIHLLQVAALIGLIALRLLKHLAPTLTAPWWMIAAATLTVVGASCYARFSLCRTFLTLLSPAALIFPLFFLFGTPVREMLLPATADAVAVAPATPTAPIVMVLLDELPLSSLLDESNEIDPIRYPNLAALCRDAYWFRDATTVATGTTLSVPIILTGRIPEDRRLSRAAQYPDNLFTWLAAIGYRMQVFESHTRLCPDTLCSDAPRRGTSERLDRLATDLAVITGHLVSPPDLATRLPAISGTWSDFTTSTVGDHLRRLLGSTPDAAPAARPSDIPQQFAAFLETLVPDEPPALHFIHLMLPHLPWRFLPSGKEYGPVGAPIFPHGVRHETWGPDEWEVVQGFQRHLLQVGYVDRLMGQLLTKLRQQKLYDPALIVVVADHGAGFRAGAGRRGVKAPYTGDLLNVPLLVKLPGQKRGLRSDRNVQTVDVLPTLAAALELAVPWDVDGQSALDSSLPEKPLKFTIKPVGETFTRSTWIPAELRADRDRSVERKLRLFGSGARTDGLFKIGGRADLLGRRASDLVAVASAPRQEGSEITIKLDQPWSFDEVDPTSPFIPAHITGQMHFEQPRDGPVELAVAVNGVIEAVTQSFERRDDPTRFTAMVREASLLAGRNLIEIFEVRGHSRATELLPTRQARGGFELIGQPDEVALRAPDGRRIEPVPGHLEGRAKIRPTRVGIWLSGWAAIGRRAQPAERLVVFIDGRFALATENGLQPETDEAPVQGRWKRRASFKIQLPGALIQSNSEIRVFAILGETASELPLRWPEAPERKPTGK